MEWSGTAKDSEETCPLAHPHKYLFAPIVTVGLFCIRRRMNHDPNEDQELYLEDDNFGNIIRNSDHDYGGMKEPHKG